MTTDYAAEARSASATASAATRRAVSKARKADACYARAEQTQRELAWMTTHPDLWKHSLRNTAALEADMLIWASLGDAFLLYSFHATRQAASYRELAARVSRHGSRPAHHLRVIM